MKSKVLLLFIIPVTVAIIARLPFLTKEFVLEEALHVKVAKAIAARGYPSIYYSELQPNGIFLDRTPVFFLPLAVVIKLFGTKEIAIRAILLLFSLTEIIAVIYFIKRLFKKNALQIAMITALLMATSPYYIQTNLQIHLDNAIFTLLTSSFLLLCLLKIQNRQNRWGDYLQIALIFLLVFSIKYETGLMAFGIILIFCFIYYRQFIKKFLISIAAAVLTSQLLFFLYNLAFGHAQQTLIPAQRIFWVFQNIFFPKFTSINASQHSLSLWANNYFLLIRFLSWINIPLILLSFYTLIRIVKTKTLKNDLRIRFLIIWLFLFSIIYLLGGWAGDFPRYFVPAMPALFILIALVLTNDLASITKRVSTTSGLVALAIGTALLVIAKNYGFLFLDHITGWLPELQIPFFAIILGFAALVLISTFYKKFAAYLLIILITLYIGQTILQLRHDASSNFSLTNFYGYSGYKLSGQFLKNTLGKNDAILTIDPVAFYYEGKFYDYFYFGQENKNISLITEPLIKNKIKAVALPQLLLNNYSQKIGFNIIKVINQDYKNHRNFGGEHGIEVFY